MSLYKFRSFINYHPQSFCFQIKRQQKLLKGSIIFMNFENFTCEYLLKENYLDYELSGYGLGLQAIAYQWLFFL